MASRFLHGLQSKVVKLLFVGWYSAYYSVYKLKDDCKLKYVRSNVSSELYLKY